MIINKLAFAPLKLYVTDELASASEVVTVATEVLPSSTLKLAADVKTGALSLTSVIFTVIACVVELVPSLAVTVAV